MHASVAVGQFVSRTRCDKDDFLLRHIACVHVLDLSIRATPWMLLQLVTITLTLTAHDGTSWLQAGNTSMPREERCLNCWCAHVSMEPLCFVCL